MPARKVPAKFQVAFSLAGEQRELVRAIASAVEKQLGDDTVFLDEWYDFYLAGTDADLRLEEIYADRAELVVLCVSGHYGGKAWTQAELGAVRAREMKLRESQDRRDQHRILPIRVGEGEVKGIRFNSIVPDVRDWAIDRITNLILNRLQLILGDDKQGSRPMEKPERSNTAQRDGEQTLISRIVTAEEWELVADLLSGHWSLVHLKEVTRASPESALQVIRNAGQSGESWARLIGAFVASVAEIPSAELISLAFTPERGNWGGRFPPLAYLRFTRPAKRTEASHQLADAMRTVSLDGSFDAARLAIFGCGFLARLSSIESILDDSLALNSAYPNEKLGPYAVQAYLHSYLQETNEQEEKRALRDFTEAYQATDALQNLRLHFFDYLDEVQCLTPGKAVALFRHLRDHSHLVPLSAVLAAMSVRPNSLLLGELIKLAEVKPGSRLCAEALHAAAAIGTQASAERLAGCVADDLTGSLAAWLLAVGHSKQVQAADKILAIINDSQFESSGGWLDDIRHNALWAAGEIGRADPSFAIAALDRVRVEPDDPYARALAWLGLAKAGSPLLESEIKTAFEFASNFFERTIIAMAAAFAGWPLLLAEGIRGTIQNYSPPHRLLPHLQRDIRVALRDHAGDGGRALLTLLDLGDFT